MQQRHALRADGEAKGSLQQVLQNVGGEPVVGLLLLCRQQLCLAVPLAAGLKQGVAAGEAFKLDAHRGGLADSGSKVPLCDTPQLSRLGAFESGEETTELAICGRGHEVLGLQLGSSLSVLGVHGLGLLQQVAHLGQGACLAAQHLLGVFIPLATPYGGPQDVDVGQLHVESLPAVEEVAHVLEASLVGDGSGRIPDKGLRLVPELCQGHSLLQKYQVGIGGLQQLLQAGEGGLGVEHFACLCLPVGALLAGVVQLRQHGHGNVHLLPLCLEVEQPGNAHVAAGASRRLRCCQLPGRHQLLDSGNPLVGSR
mmetsp:Transcript_4008/g.11312  ORF Transcript_4008/g.11312 Transcript_4008/m.11312 type:complete len:311 (+) Transcript_4008:3069-4001(+)